MADEFDLSQFMVEDSEGSEVTTEEPKQTSTEVVEDKKIETEDKKVVTADDDEDEEIDFSNPDSLLDESEREKSPAATAQPSMFEIEAQRIKEIYGFEPKNLDEFLNGVQAISADAILDKHEEYNKLYDVLTSEDKLLEDFASTLKGKTFGTTLAEKVQYVKDRMSEFEDDINDHKKEATTRAVAIEEAAKKQAETEKTNRINAIRQANEERKENVRKFLKENTVLGAKAKETSFDKFFENNAAELRKMFNDILKDPKAAVDFIVKNAPEYEGIRKKHMKFEIDRKRKVEKAAETPIKIGTAADNQDGLYEVNNDQYL